MQNYQFHAHFSRTMGENQPFFIQPPSSIHHTYADRMSERIRVLYRNQGFLPHKWVTIVAACSPSTTSTIYENSSISHRQHHNNLTWHERVKKKLKFNQKMNSHPQNLCFVAIFYIWKRCNKFPHSTISSQDKVCCGKIEHRMLPTMRERSWNKGVKMLLSHVVMLLYCSAAVCK